MEHSKLSLLDCFYVNAVKLIVFQISNIVFQELTPFQQLLEKKKEKRKKKRLEKQQETEEDKEEVSTYYSATT